MIAKFSLKILELGTPKVSEDCQVSRVEFIHNFAVEHADEFHIVFDVESIERF